MVRVIIGLDHYELLPLHYELLPYCEVSVIHYATYNSLDHDDKETDIILFGG